MNAVPAAATEEASWDAPAAETVHAEATSDSEGLDEADLNDLAEMDAAILEAAGLMEPKKKGANGGSNAPLPKRFMDMIHLNRLSFVKRRLKFREEQWKKRKKDLAYDIPTMDLKIEGLKREKDQVYANKKIEELREIVDRDGRWPAEHKRLLLLQAKELLGNPEFWDYGDSINPIPNITPLELDDDGNVVEAEFDELYNVISKKKD